MKTDMTAVVASIDPPATDADRFDYTSDWDAPKKWAAWATAVMITAVVMVFALIVGLTYKGNVDERNRERQLVAAMDCALDPDDCD